MKAVLKMEKPKRCSECPLKVRNRFGIWYCTAFKAAKGRTMELLTDIEPMPRWCPLKEEPENEADSGKLPGRWKEYIMRKFTGKEQG